MSGPPLEPAISLPEDWHSQVLNFAASGPETAVLEFLKECVRHHGDSALSIRGVQMLAEWVTGASRVDQVPLLYLHKLLKRIVRYAGTWAVENALGEANVQSHPFDIAARLDSADAELRTLDYLIACGWKPIEKERRDGDFDWYCWKKRRWYCWRKCELAVEVKHKAAAGSAGHALEWFVRGLSLLPTSNWMFRFGWHCWLPDDVRLPDVKRFAKRLREHWDAVAEMLPLEIDRLASGESVTVPGSEFVLQEEFIGGRSSVAITLPSTPRVRIVVEENDNPEILWVTGETGAFVPDKLGEAEVTLVEKVLGKLGAQEQNVKRSNDGLYVFDWEVPWHWEQICDRATLRIVSDRIARKLSIREIAIWPQGAFNLANEPWVLSTAAEAKFHELGQRVRRKMS